ncbi:MAG: L,D-transpeptidase family protein [Deltaproteobacteria bacterium]|nr:L,D-transpeptidase family protein [Deltaproteobacteria bacterium]
MFPRLIPTVIAIAWAGGLAFGNRVEAANLSEQVSDVLRGRMEAAGTPLRILCRGELICESVLLPPFYERRSFLPAWSADDGPRPEVDSFIRGLQQAGQEGLRAEDYHLSNIKTLLAELRQDMALKRPLSPEKLADLDLMVTDSFLIYASHLLTGRVNPETIQAEWYAQSRKANLDRILQIALDSQQTENVLQGLLPRHPGYGRLRQALRDYRNIAQKGGWPSVPSGPKMRQGDSGRRVRILRARLVSTRDLQPVPKKSAPLFDESLDRAVRKFQLRHGLDIDGIVGPATLAALNVPVEKRIRQIEGNMERWRWLPQDFGSRYILVNIAKFGLEVIENGRPVLTMRAIVGKPYQRTPVFSAQMTYLVLRPFWHVPPSIAEEEMLPLILQDPNYLAKNQIKLFEGWGSAQKEIDSGAADWSKVSADSFPYNLRQEPGPLNPLGRIKFMFPNKFNVYLHDTPSPELFKKTEREFSHGCIRIEKPIELAEYLLRGDPQWTRESLAEAIDQSIDHTVRLPEPIPIHVLYWTAGVEEDGSVHFRKDIYERDEPLREALEAKPPTPETAGFDSWKRK